MKRPSRELIAAFFYLTSGVCMIISLFVPSDEFSADTVKRVQSELTRVSTDYERRQILVKEACTIVAHREPPSADAVKALDDLERLNQDLLRHSTDGTLFWELSASPTLEQSGCRDQAKP